MPNSNHHVRFQLAVQCLFLLPYPVEYFSEEVKTCKVNRDTRARLPPAAPTRQSLRATTRTTP